MYNGRFESWSRGVHFLSPVSVGIVVADGWYVGPGQGGQVTVDQRTVPLGGEAGLPGEARFVMRVKWLQSYTPTPIPGLWTSLIEHGEPYHGGSSGFDKLGVKDHAGKTVQVSIYAKVDEGAVAARILIWQSFGAGALNLPDVEIPLMPYTLITTDWTLITGQIVVPSIEGKAIELNGTDYFGFGLDLSGGAAPGLELACADIVDL